MSCQSYFAARRSWRGVSSLCVGAFVAVAACSETTPTQVGSDGLADSLVVGLLPTNALGAAISFRTRGGDSARARYWVAGNPSASVRAPATALGSGTGARRVLMLGLRENTGYTGLVETLYAGRWVSSDTFRIQSGRLPTVLATLRVSFTGAPASGFLVTGFRGAGSSWIIAFDSTGTLAWYCEVEDAGGVGVVTPQATGSYTIYTGTTSGWQPVPGRFTEVRPDGSQIRMISVTPPDYLDNHELQYQARDTIPVAAYFSVYEMKSTNLATIGGPVDTLLAYHRVARWTPDGAMSSIIRDGSLYTIADRIEPPKLPPFDLAHPNSIDQAADGDLVISWRNVGEVMKVDQATGSIRWRLGGPRPTLRIVNDPLQFFSGQHSARMTAANRVLLMDNGLRHVPTVSRAVEYQIDTQRGTATLVWSFTHPKQYYSGFTGAVQRLPSGNTLVYFSTQSAAVEVSPSGAIVSEGIVLDGTTLVAPYRVTWFKSLYAAGRP